MFHTSLLSNSPGEDISPSVSLVLSGHFTLRFSEENPHHAVHVFFFLYKKTHSIRTVRLLYMGL